jgi:hypothetical protein
MHPEMARILVQQHEHEMSRQADMRRMAASAPGTRRLRLPRYRLHWSRTTLSGGGLPGRRERSWVIVISATRGL